MVEVPPEGSAFDIGGLRLRVDGDAIHRREIDQQAVVADGVASHIVAAALDRQQELMFAGEVHRTDHVGDAGRLDSQRGTLVDHLVPDRARRVVTLLAGKQQFPT